MRGVGRGYGRHRTETSPAFVRTLPHHCEGIVHGRRQDLGLCSQAFHGPTAIPPSSLRARCHAPRLLPLEHRSASVPLPSVCPPKRPPPPGVHALVCCGAR